MVKLKQGVIAMKKHFIFLLTTMLLLTLIILLSKTAQACTVSENYDRTDSAGEHFNVYDSYGNYVGYVTLSIDSSGYWSVWIEGEGALNTIFDSKETAVTAVCQGIEIK